MPTGAGGGKFVKVLTAVASSVGKGNPRTGRKSRMKDAKKSAPASSKIAGAIGKIVKDKEAKRVAQRKAASKSTKIKLDQKTGGGPRQGFTRS